MAPVRQIYPVPAPGQGDQISDTGSFLAALYAYPERAAAGEPWVRANMISSVDGAAVVDGRSGGLGGPADRMLLQVLRSLADVVLVGAGTVRAENYKPARPAAMLAELRAGRPAAPPIAVVTASLSLDPDSPLLAAAPAGARTIVITTDAAPASRRTALARVAEVIVAGEERISPAAAVAALAQRGYPRVLTEGGPSLLAQLAAAGVLDELCLTVSPVLAGGDARRILAGPPAAPPLPGGPRSLRMGHLLADDGFLFCRYLLAG